jgi:hypothetical protein
MESRPFSPAKNSGNNNNQNSNHGFNNSNSATAAAMTQGLEAMLTAENAGKAGDFLKVKAGELAKLATEGDRNIRNLAIVGGVAMVVTSAMGCIGNALRLHFLGALISFYTAVLGCVVLSLEATTILPTPQAWTIQLHHYALFLKYVWGRGYTYFVAGSLQASQWNLPDAIVGFLMMFVGVMYVITGRTTAEKLTKLRTKLCAPELLMSKFFEFDSARDGTLDREAFRRFMDSLDGLDLDHNELETAFTLIDTRHTDHISFDDFYAWWSSWDMSQSPSSSNLMV